MGEKETGDRRPTRGSMKGFLALSLFTAAFAVLLTFMMMIGPLIGW